MRMLFAATASHPMIILEFRHVSMRLCLRAAEVDHAAHTVAAIVRHQGFKEACVVGHSFGTFVASRLCQLHPDLVQSLVSSQFVLRYMLVFWQISCMKRAGSATTTVLSNAACTLGRWHLCSWSCAVAFARVLMLCHIHICLPLLLFDSECYAVLVSLAHSFT